MSLRLPKTLLLQSSSGNRASFLSTARRRFSRSSFSLLTISSLPLQGPKLSTSLPSATKKRALPSSVSSPKVSLPSCSFTPSHLNRAHLLSFSFSLSPFPALPRLCSPCSCPIQTLLLQAEPFKRSPSPALPLPSRDQSLLLPPSSLLDSRDDLHLFHPPLPHVPPSTLLPSLPSPTPKPPS